MNAPVPAPDATFDPQRLDPQQLRREFPIFARNPGLVFLDTAASAQKPRVVIDGVAEYYRADYANVHRGSYRLSERSTERYEQAREAVRRFLNAAEASEIVFVRGATEAINLVASSWGAAHLAAGDRVVVSELEHHANIVPWQLLRERIGIELVAAPIDLATGALDLAALAALIEGGPTRLVAITHVANVTGHVVDVAEVVRLAHAAGARVLLDGCQALPRMAVDVQALGCDFYAFSGHKLYGPTGIGGLYGRREVLEAMPPWQGGGDMIDVVTFARTTFAPPPARFEAGTPDISGAIGLDIALDFLASLDLATVTAHEAALTELAASRLAAMPGVRVLPAGRRRIGVVSFLVDGIHPHDLGMVLDRHNVAVRVGQHCAQPLLDRFGIGATTRASFGVYSDAADVDALAAAVAAAQRLFA